ncbi:hypothetical protein ACIG54_07540 [Streptomyces achromogenes]|uniref:hypothetical protein n=1 Tax=Streptomyces achromogenes TaxID=67255 RepID=UPI0037D5B1AA
MKHAEPDFHVLDYVTITKDTRTGLVLALGGADQAAGMLQRSGFLDASGPRGTYHRLPHHLPVQEQRRRATAASHALLAAGYSVHLDPFLNDLAVPDGGREAALRYLVQLSQRAGDASDAQERAALLTEVAGPGEGLLPLIRQAVAVMCVGSFADGADPQPVRQFMNTADALSRATDQILRLRNDIARTPAPPDSAVRTPSPAPRLPSMPVDHRRIP